LARRLAPGNIAYRPPLVAERDGELLAVFNGGSAARRKQTSVCLGSIFDCAARWWTVGSGSPDGSFALLRSDEVATELASDANKAVFKSIVEEVRLDVPFAKRVAIFAPETVLRNPEVLRALGGELRRQGEGSGTVAELARQVLELLPRPRTLRAPTSVRRLVDKARRRTSRAPRLSPLKLAFRTYIIGKMQALLQEDARALR
jgi:hypothetical protein